MKTTAILLIFLMMAACQPKNGTEKTTVEVKSQYGTFHEAEGEFAAYLDHFEKTDFPVVIKGCRLSHEGLVEFDGEKFKKFNEDFSFSFSQIPANGDYIAVITLGAADCLLPVLTTYTKNGRIIDKKTIAIGYCGHDCGFECEEFMTIKSDYSIYTSDTITSCECDDMWEIIPETCVDYVIYKEGKLLANGKIQLSEEQRKNLKK